MAGKIEWQPKEYHYDGRTLIWGEAIPRDKFKAMKEGEVFFLKGQGGKVDRLILMDSYSQIREQLLITGNM